MPDLQRLLGALPTPAATTAGRNAAGAMRENAVPTTPPPPGGSLDAYPLPMAGATATAGGAMGNAVPRPNFGEPQQLQAALEGLLLRGAGGGVGGSVINRLLRR